MKDKLSGRKDILDYAPTFAATAEVAKGLVVYIDRMPTDFAYGEDDSPDHLRWMVDQIVANAQCQAHPVDKLSRWLGYVQGILRAHRVLDTVAERDRTRPIFHAAYIEMGIKPPEKRDRQATVDAVFERPDLETLVLEWSFPFRSYVVASFMRGLTRLGSIADDLPSAHVTGYFHSAIFGDEYGYLRRALGVGKKEAEFRFDFFEQFMERSRAEELKALSKGNAAYLAGSLVSTGLYALGIIAILLQATLGHTVTAILTGCGFAFAYGLTVIVQTKLRRIRDKALLRLPLFRKSLPWREEDISGVAILDDMQQGRPGRES